MKKYLYLSVAALALASCADDEYMGNPEDLDTRKALTFDLSTPNLTRAISGAAAAAALNNEFIVWGEKNEAAEPTTATAAANMVFENYVVNWTANTAGTTTTNSSDWEYVGKENHGYDSYVTPNIGTGKSQSIKYWDYSANNYVFTAISALPADIAAGKVVIAKTTQCATGGSGRDKGYTVTVKNGASLGSIYYSDRCSVVPTSGTSTQVNLTFRNFMSKIRFGMYETVPGYSVAIDKVYYNSASSTTGFGVDGSFLVSGTNDTKYVVTYDSNDKVKVTLASGGSTNTKSFLEVATSAINAATSLGTTSADATKEEFTSIMPNPANTTGLTLKVDYTLTSEDTGETIKVTGATAGVPAQYCQWQSNYAYTYIFKISDNTNGTTGQSIVGLYPITFDAVVENDATTGEQNTISTVATPSITTYQKGAVATANEYSASKGDIYVMVEGKTDISAGKLYTVTGSNITEASVSDALNIGATTSSNTTTGRNGIALTTATIDYTVTSLPMEDGSTTTVTAKSVGKFTPAAGTYAFVMDVTSGTPTATYLHTAVMLTDSSAPSGFPTGYYTDPACTTDASTYVQNNTYYQKVANANHTYAVKVITVE